MWLKRIRDFLNKLQTLGTVLELFLEALYNELKATHGESHALLKHSNSRSVPRGASDGGSTWIFL